MEVKYVIVFHSHNIRHVKGAIGPFLSVDEAREYQSKRNFGPNGSIIVPLKEIDNNSN